MDGLLLFLVALSGVASCSRGWRSESVLEVTVRPGDDITLYCDCELSTGVFIVWYRNCSHENQPPLVLKAKKRSSESNADIMNYFKIPPPFQLVRNFSSESYDLRIMNITDSEEGLYYCGTEQKTLEGKEYISSKMYYEYGNVTTMVRFSSGPDPPASWMMVSAPAFTILASVLSFILVYCVCQKADKESQALQERPDPRGRAGRDQDEDACFTRVVFRPKGWSGAAGGGGRPARARQLDSSRHQME